MRDLARDVTPCYREVLIEMEVESLEQPWGTPFCLAKALRKPELLSLAAEFVFTTSKPT